MSLTVPNNAPFTGAQRMWLKGFLDGINTAFGPASAGASATSFSPPAPAPSGIPVTIAYGSQTGNSESLGKKITKTLAAKGHSPVLKDMAELAPADLSGIGHLLIVTSTYGDGEPPDNAAALHSALHAADAPALSSLKFSVLALGDSNYPSFCKCGHDFDQRLTALGANRLTPIIECDVDYDEPFAAWLSQVEQSLVA
jgi:sulfite reductase alpha subunit-like flavoprotein